jgi:hypothetical protein
LPCQVVLVDVIFAQACYFSRSSWFLLEWSSVTLLPNVPLEARLVSLVFSFQLVCFLMMLLRSPEEIWAIEERVKAAFTGVHKASGRRAECRTKGMVGREGSRNEPDTTLRCFFSRIRKRFAHHFN